MSSAREKLKGKLGRDRFATFANAIFEKDALIVKTSFQAQHIENNYSHFLAEAFGFVPEIKVDPAAFETTKNESPAQVLPIQRARRRKIGFAARELILMNLPHSDPKAPVWVRRNGHKALLVQGGYKIDPKDKTGKKAVYLGIPYGPKARLILFYLMTEAKLTKNRRIFLGDSFNAFLEAIGSSKNGGKKTGRDAVKKQLERISTASFYTTENASFDDADYFAKSPTYRFTGEASLWFSKKSPDQMALWDSFIDLSPEFYESITKSAIPLDWEILLKLKNSALEIDLYALLTYEAARAVMSGKGHFIPWAALQDQFGGSYGDVKDFAKKARAALAKIKKLYPALKLGKRAGGLDILPDSLPSVERPELPQP